MFPLFLKVNQYIKAVNKIECQTMTKNDKGKE